MHPVEDAGNPQQSPFPICLPVLFVLGRLSDLAVDPDVAHDEREEGDDARHDELVIHAATSISQSVKKTVSDMALLQGGPAESYSVD